MILEELKAVVGPNEKVYYEGKPNKTCYIFEGIFNPLLPIALLWALIDFGFIGAAFSTSSSEMSLFLVPFFMFHLMPVWIYLAGALFVGLRYNNTAYVVTDHAIYVASGILNRTINRKPFAELSQINLHRGLFDQMYGVGDIIASTNQYNSKGNPIPISINSIDNYLEVYNIVKKLQTDIYSDTMYPNDLRPEENHGYNTKYKGF